MHSLVLPLTRPAWLIALVMSVAAPVAAAEIDSVRLVLHGGDFLEGRVCDLHDARLEVIHPLGRSYVNKRDVRSWILKENREGQGVEGEGVEGNAASGHRLQILVLKAGHEVAGEVRYVPEVEEWLVKLPAGTASYPDDKVLRVIQGSGLCSDGAFSPRQGFHERVTRAIEKVRSDSKVSQMEGSHVLTQAGFFALRAMDEAIVGSDPGGRLARIALKERFRTALPDEVNEVMPNFFETMLGGTEEERVKALRQVFLSRGAEVYSLMVVLLLDTEQPPQVRGFCVEVLQQMNRIPELLKAYQSAQGTAQLAVAVALGDAGIYIGIETLVEALTLDLAAARALAVQKLREYTGLEFGFDPDMEPSTQRTAVASWSGWWREHRSQIEEQLTFRLRPELENPARIRARELWRRGNVAWEEGDIQTAERLFQHAIEEDPTCLPPFVCLGIIAYQNHFDYKAANEWFARALRRAPESGEDDLLRLAYYHLGRIHELVFDYELAERAYRSAINLDPNYAEAWHDLGMVIYQDALMLRDASPAQRRERFLDASRTLEDGLKRLREFQRGLYMFTRANLPIGSDLPFSTRDHNRNLKSLKAHLKDTEALFAYRIAVIQLALGDRSRAKEWGEIALKGPTPKADYHLLLANILNLLGEKKEAEKELAKARALDPKHPRLPEKKKPL
ncbi:MAG: tetratricopeptide repeat protein [Planctomycetota bacterium]